jgi:hypothetical protein
MAQSKVGVCAAKRRAPYAAEQQLAIVERSPHFNRVYVVAGVGVRAKDLPA